MPIRGFAVDLSAAGRTVIVAETGMRINTVSVTKLSVGAEFQLDLGNNQRTGPIDRRGRLIIEADVPDRDVCEGLALISDTAQAGLSVYGFVSFQRTAERPAGISYAPAD